MPQSKVAEYKAHAKQLRTLASRALTDEAKRQYEAMAVGWEKLALKAEQAAVSQAQPREGEA